MKRLTLGSVTDYLVRNTNIPVMVVRPSASAIEAGPERALNRIVVPLDASELAEEVLTEVSELALKFGSTVSLVHILTPETYSQKEIMQPGLPWWDEDIAIANSYLEEVAAHLTAQGLTVSKDVVLSDNIASAILDYATRTRADVIAFATRGKGGVGRFVFGSVADEITRRSPISLLVLHPGRGAAAEDTSGRSESGLLAKG
jgi:nucleotide-binding universal stress UspA family protein